MKAHTVKIMHTVAKKREGTFLSTEYLGSRQLHQWSCSKGHVFNARPANIMAGRWCPICSRADKDYGIQYRRLAELTLKHWNPKLKLSAVNPKWDTSTLLAKRGIFLLIDVLAALDLYERQIRTVTRELTIEEAWTETGVAVLGRTWFVNMPVFAKYTYPFAKR